MNKLYLVTFLFLALSLSGQASALPGFKVGYTIWSQNITGDIEHDGDRASITDDFAITDPETSAKIYFETRDILPFFPDFRVYYDNFEYEGKTSVNYKFGNRTFAENAKVIIGSETFGLTVFYSPNFLNILGARVGLDVRKVSFDLSLSHFEADTKDETEVSYNATSNVAPLIPLLYGHVSAKIPVADLYAYAEGSYVEFRSSQLRDSKVAVGLDIVWGMQMEAGYRRLSYQVITSGTDIDLVVGGYFIEFSYVF